MIPIIQISDLKLDINKKRYEEIKKVFDSLMVKLNDFPSSLKKPIIVITGQCFVKKNLSKEDIQILYYIFDKLSENNQVIVGNDPCVSSILRKEKNIINLVNTYKQDGYNFIFINSAESAESAKEFYRDEENQNILIVNYNVEKIDPAMRNQSVAVMVGGESLCRKIAPNCYAGGNFIQQNAFDGQLHGVVLWQITGKTSTSRVIGLSNDYGFIQVFAKKRSIKEVLASINPPKYILGITYIANQCSDEDIGLIRKTFPTYHGEIYRIITHEKPLEFDVRIIQTIREELIKLGSNHTEDIIQLHQRTFPVKTGTVKWKLISMEWSNLYIYGENNKINFGDLNRVVGIIAPNNMGKSTVIDLIILGIFGVILRGDAKSILHKGYTKGFITVQLDIAGTGTMVISRKHSASHSKVQVEINGNDVSKKEVSENYKMIRSIIGHHDELLASSISIGDNQRGIVERTKLGRKDLLAKLFGLRNVPDKIKEIKKVKRTIEDEINQLHKPKDTLDKLQRDEKEYKIKIERLEENNGKLREYFNRSIVRVNQIELERKMTELEIEKINSQYSFSENCDACQNNKKILISKDYVNKCREKLASLNTELGKIKPKDVSTKTLDMASNTYQKIARYKMELKKIHEDIQAVHEYNKKYPELAKQLEIYEQYLNLLGKEGLQFMAVQTYFPYIVERVNTLLAEFNIVITYTVSATGINLFSDGIPIESLSGFHKFVINIAFRFIFSKLVSPITEFIIIDEGFGCLDEENIGKIQNLINNLKMAYRFIMIITHVDDIKRIVDYRLDIQKKGRTSSFV